MLLDNEQLMAQQAGYDLQCSFGGLSSSPQVAGTLGRARRPSMEGLPPGAGAPFLGDAAAFQQQQRGALGLLLAQQQQQQPDAGGGRHHQPGNGLLAHAPPPSMGLVDKPFALPVGNGFEPMSPEAEEPGPLPCLPRAGRGFGGGPNAALLQQQHQQLLQHAAAYGGAAGAGGGGGRQPRPRRHSVTIGMLNEHQQAALLASGALPPGWAPPGMPPASPGIAAPPRVPPLPQQSSPSKQLQAAGLSMQQAAAAAAAAQLGVLGKPSLAQQAFLAGAPGGLPLPQLAHAQPPQPVRPPVGAGDMPPSYALNAPRMPGAGSSRRHSWAPMGAEASMAYARSWLMQQQQARGANLTAQLGDAGALFINHDQQEQLGSLGMLGAAGLAPAPRPPGANGLIDGADAATLAALQGAAAAAAAGMSVGAPAPALPLFGADPKDQLAQHLHQQLAQLQLAQQQQQPPPQAFIGGRLDPYAEPFVSQGAPLAAGLVGGLDPLANPYTAALQHELLAQQQQTALQALQQRLNDDALSPAAAAAAASMYAPLHVNGVAVDTQLLVSPFADNWDVLGAGAGGALAAGSLAAAGGGGGLLSPLSGGVMGVGAKGGKAPPLASAGSAASSVGSGGSASARSGAKGVAGAAAGAGAAPAAAAAAAASMLASLPPQSKVCSDAPWDLKKAADEDAKALAEQQAQVEKLAAALEHSRTLQAVQEAVASATAAAAAAQQQQQQQQQQQEGQQPADAAAAADSGAAVFCYRLPDSGDDTWGGSAAGGGGGAAGAARAPEAAGSSCISQEPSNKLFVGNIGWWVTEEDLLHWFSRFGTVINVKIMYNSRKMHKPKDKWRSREYGFIDYASPEEAAKAIVWMDGVELPDLMKDTCGIIVQYAKPTSAGEAGGGGGQ